MLYNIITKYYLEINTKINSEFNTSNLRLKSDNIYTITIKI